MMLWGVRSMEKKENAENIQEKENISSIIRLLVLQQLIFVD
jgi:hypothetical protein